MDHASATMTTAMTGLDRATAAATTTNTENENQKKNQTKKKEIYPFQRNDAERERLDRQHKLLNRLCRNVLLDPQIDLSNIVYIADVGTGTGIWIEDIISMLSQSPLSDSERQYSGFDISPQHFPSTAPLNTTFHTHDILLPFPPAFHSQYDLVHIRLLVLALRKDQFETAIKNVLQLLKPGGWIQWEEFEAINLDFIPSSEITRLVQSISRNIARSAKLSNTPCADIYKILGELGCEDVRFVDYDSRGRTDLVADAREWTKAGGRAGLFPALLRDGTGRSEEEARAVADELYKTWAATIDQGVEPTMPFGRVVGRKQSSE